MSNVYEDAKSRTISYDGPNTVVSCVWNALGVDDSDAALREVLDGADASIEVLGYTLTGKANIRLEVVDESANNYKVTFDYVAAAASSANRNEMKVVGYPPVKPEDAPRISVDITEGSRITYYAKNTETSTTYTHPRTGQSMSNYTDDGRSYYDLANYWDPAKFGDETQLHADYLAAAGTPDWWTFNKNNTPGWNAAYSAGTFNTLDTVGDPEAREIIIGTSNPTLGTKGIYNADVGYNFWNEDPTPIGRVYADSIPLGVETRVPVMSVSYEKILDGDMVDDTYFKMVNKMMFTTNRRSFPASVSDPWDAGNLMLVGFNAERLPDGNWRANFTIEHRSDNLETFYLVKEDGTKQKYSVRLKPWDHATLTYKRTAVKEGTEASVLLEPVKFHSASPYRSSGFEALQIFNEFS